MPLSESESQSVMQTMRQAGEILLSYWPNKSSENSTKKNLKIISKADGTPVTVADHESSELIEHQLQKMFPSDLVLSEENTVDVSKLKDASRVWIVDPLDGTKSFIRGDDDFSVLVALSENGKVTAGFMYFPARNQFAWGRELGGAFIDGKRLKVSPESELKSKRIYIRDNDIKPDMQKFRCEPMDSGLALLKVASGELDGAVIRLGILQEWDVAAAMCIISESGGTITDESGLTIPVGLGQPHTNYFIAATPSVHTQLVEIIAS